MVDQAKAQEDCNGASKKGPLLPIPFSLSITPMEALLFMTFEQDPDSVYLAFEAQRFDDDLQGTGRLVIGWRVDGKVDIFHDPELRLDPDGYDICVGGLAHMAARDFKDSFFTVGASGMRARLSFEDLQGRLIELEIQEKNKRGPRPFGFLAPVGDSAESPSAMPILMLHDFYFVRRKGTEMSITIDGRSHRPDVINFPIDWSIMYFTRYTPDPMVIFFNRAAEGPVSTLSVFGEERLVKNETIYELDYRGETPLLKSMKKITGGRSIALSFEPAFPNLSAFAGTSVSGGFSIKGDPALGEIRGGYTVTRVDGGLEVVLVPSEGWIPKRERLGVRLLYTVVGLFRNWPKSYRWTAFIREATDGQLHMESTWERMH